MRSGSVRVAGLNAFDGVKLDNEKEAAELKAEQNHHAQGNRPAAGTVASFASKPHKHLHILPHTLLRCRFPAQVTGLYGGKSISLNLLDQ